MAQITTASSAARPVRRVDREAAAIAAACAAFVFSTVSPAASRWSGDREPRARGRARVLRRVTEKLLDAQQLVVLRASLATGRGTALDLPGVGRAREVGADRVGGRARAVADHARMY